MANLAHYTDRVRYRLDVIAKLEKMQGSILAFETVKLLRDVNDADLSKVRSFMIAISQIQTKEYEAKVIITRLCFKEVSFSCYSKREVKFCSRVFPNRLGQKITSLDLISVIEDEEFFSKLSDKDAVRVCLLLSLEVIFMGRKLVHEFDDTLMRLVDNLEAWNAFPWGKHIWIHLYKQMLNIVSNHKAEHLKGLHMCRNYVPTYTLSGFVWSFKIWILESFQRINYWWTKDSEVISRGLVWSRKAIFKSYDVSYLFSKVLVRKTNGVLVDKLEFSEEFPNLSIDFYDELNKEFVELFESPSTSSRSACSNLDIEEDANEVKLKKDQEKDKIRSKLDKNGKRDEARKSLK
nr:phospholipase-like protein [Tanacetum cinerariifolium]GFA70496.1 phospholipase-like protein [Tanacetum cinerariifolium]